MLAQRLLHYVYAKITLDLCDWFKRRIVPEPKGYCIIFDQKAALLSQLGAIREALGFGKGNVYRLGKRHINVWGEYNEWFTLSVWSSGFYKVLRAAFIEKIILKVMYFRIFLPNRRRQTST